MAISRRMFRGDEQVKSFSDMTIVVPPGLCGIAMTCPFDQTDHQIMNRCQNSSGSTNRHSGSIFSEGNIPPVVKASLNPPMPSPE
jgi:hypothetical protein